MQMNPYLSFKGECEAAFKFYEQSLGGQLGAIFRYGGTPLAGHVPADWSDKVMHGSLTLGDQPLPNGAGMRVAIRRGLRVGRRAGMPVEDLGVLPDERHFMTKDDLLNDNVDLINKAGSLLAALQPTRAFTLTAQPVSPTQINAVVDTQGVSRLDIYLEDRPIQSIDVVGGQATFSITKPTPASITLEIRGFDGAQLVARYRTSI